MELGLTLKEFSELSRGRHLSQQVSFPNNEGFIHVSTHSDLGLSEVLHYHDEPHLTMVLNGGTLDKRKSLEAERMPGGLMFFHAGEPHRTINKLFPTRYLSLAFSADFFQRTESLENNLANLMRQNSSAKFILLKIYREVLNDDEYFGDSVEMLLFNLIDNKFAKDKNPPKWASKVKQLLNDNWNKDISLNDLANETRVHPKTISRYFPKYFACTFGEYRRQIKVEKSLPLIKNSKLSLTEIAHECNFADQSHFIRDFKRMTGFLPKHFQKL